MLYHRLLHLRHIILITNVTQINLIWKETMETQSCQKTKGKITIGNPHAWIVTLNLSVLNSSLKKTQNRIPRTDSPGGLPWVSCPVWFNQLWEDMWREVMWYNQLQDTSPVAVGWHSVQIQGNCEAERHPKMYLLCQWSLRSTEGKWSGGSEDKITHSC